MKGLWKGKIKEIHTHRQAKEGKWEELVEKCEAGS
jgi:hypothetical protein